MKAFVLLYVRVCVSVIYTQLMHALWILISMTWFIGLTKMGLYYEGFVDNLEVLEGHRRCTMTSYGTRNWKKSNKLQIEGNNKENDKDYILVQV